MKKTAIAAITMGQVKKIHSLLHAMGIDDATYRTLLFNSFRANSSKELNYFQAESLIQDLEAKAISAGVWEKRTTSKKFEEWGHRRGGMATPPQLRKIEALWKEVSRATDPEERKNALRSFLERVAKASDLRFLDMERASKVINALKRMKKRKSENDENAQISPLTV